MDNNSNVQSALLIVFEKQIVQDRQVKTVWRLKRVESDRPEDEVMDLADNERLFRGLNLQMHLSESEGYWLNLNSSEPSVFVMWCMEEGLDVPTPWTATVSQNEAQRMLEAGETVERVPMSGAMRAWLEAYTTEVNKQRDRVVPLSGDQNKRH